MRGTAALAALALALGGCGGESGTYVVVILEQGSAPAAIAEVQLDLGFDGRTDQVTVRPSDGMPIRFPARQALKIVRGEGRFEVTAVARATAAGPEVARGHNEGVVMRGDTTTIVVTLGQEVGSDAGSDAGTDAALTDAALPDSEVDAAACNTARSPKDEPCLVSDTYGVFVAPLGDDSRSGAKAEPVRTLGKALQLARSQGKSRVFVCDGTYAERVTLDSNADGISLFGGFACGTWSYTGFRPKITPAVAGPALTIDSLVNAVRVEDLELTALAGGQPGASSIAVFVRGTPNVTFARVKMVAGAGMAGAMGLGPAASNLIATAALTGNTAAGSTRGAPSKTCSCPVFGSSLGGFGGHADDGLGGMTPEVGTSGSSTPNPGWAPNAAVSSPRACDSGGTGRAGGNGASGSGGMAATALGVLSTSGWAPAAGAGGSPSNPGQGGGGGAADSGGGGGGIGGGGGACGSCGGAGGRGGQGGGASVALLYVNSGVVLLQCSLTSNDAGAGGRGGTGEPAIGGGAGGSIGTAGGCPGGPGGAGAGGPGGAGGAGGVSVGILYTPASAPPSIDGVPTAQAATLPIATLGQPGGAGPAGMGGTAFGAGAAGSPGSMGMVGIARAVHPLP